jgi:ankyrin repeat protein
MATLDDDGDLLRFELHFAAQDGDLDRVRQLIREGHDVNAFDEISKTPLHYAAESEHFEIVEYLIAHGADVNAHDEVRIGNTPLRDVAETCSLRMARLLVDAGADPAIPGWMQLTALDKAKHRERGDGPEVYELLTRAARAPRR